MTDRRDGLRDSTQIDAATAKVRDTSWRHDPKPYLTAPFRPLTTSAETHFLYHLCTTLGEGNFAEIGVAGGGNTCAIGHGISRGALYAVDLFKPDNRDDAARMSRVRAELPRYFADHLPAVDFRLFKMDSSTLGWALEVPFRFVFIDGSHEYRWCLEDWRAWSRLVEPEGIVVFHDAHLEGPRRVITEELGPGWEFIRQIYSMKAFRRAV